jgi:ribosomal protein S18 acetylase RimI-like enzyme
VVTLTWRTEITAADVARVVRVCEATGFFTADESRLAGELVEVALEEGPTAGYEFIVADDGDDIAGYTCFGHIDGTESAYDLFWIVVDPRKQGVGLGKQLLARTDAAVLADGGSRYYAETSSTDKYEPTRQFYLRAGFKEVARIADFYRPGDGKVIYERVVGA